MNLREGRKAEEREQKEKRERHEAERCRRRLRDGGASETRRSEGEFQGRTTLVTTPSLLLWLENLTKCMESPAGQLCCNYL